MKNIIIKICLLVFLINAVSQSKAQLPLLQGDAVVTHSQNNANGLGNIVLRVIKTNNTSTAPFGANWNTPSMANPPGPGTKPSNWNASNWVQGVLGNIFGITLDNQPSPNIYVSSSQIYSGSSQNASKVWRLDGTTGSNTLVFDFANKVRSLGNLKYQKIGSTENMYVSNWDNGQIERLTGNSGTTSLWSIQTAFNPKFGLGADNPQFLPYGLAIRSMGSGNYRLYYAKISSIAPYNTNEIWSVNLNPSGDFIISSEQQELFPLTALTSYTGTVISDIAFTEDGKKMLVGQQTFNSFGALCAHRSNVAEFVTQAIDHNWNSSVSIYPAGMVSGMSSSCGGGPGDWNCVGGVSYSNNILQGNSNDLSCESTVWFSSDAIIFTSNCFAYGIQGMKSNGGAGNAASNSIIIDQDDYTTNSDKMQLGDVEVYKKSLNCSPCNCGNWLGSPTLNGKDILKQNTYNPAYPLQKMEPANREEISTKIIVNKMEIESKLSPSSSSIIENARQNVYPLQFVQGNVSGLINAPYQCTGSCETKYLWSIKNSSNASVIATGTILPVDLSLYNSAFQCGNYSLIIKAQCGGNFCDSILIPITIICEPTNCCKAVIDIDQVGDAKITATTTGTGSIYSTANIAYNINFSIPMSEVRVSVEEFRLNANYLSCINCNNRPVTWGNILKANLNGTSMLITQPVSGSPATGSIQADYREAVYNTGIPLSPTSAGLNLTLALPQTTEIPCCDVTIHLCLKFTFKDNQCRECVQMVCGDYKLIAPPIKHGPIYQDATPIKDLKIQKYNVGH